jgi:hypothetical protein
MLTGSPTWEEYASFLSNNASDTERIALAVSYRFEVEQSETTDMTVIANDYFRRARWIRPINISSTANHLARKGWLSLVGRSNRRKLWRITRKGYTSIMARIGKRSIKESVHG